MGVILSTNVYGSGMGPAVVLLHSLALDRSMWQPLLQRLETERPILAMDLRGHGRSPAEGTFTIEDMADDVAVTIAHLGYDRAIVVGLSMGGCVAQALAVRHPDVVTALGLIDTTAWYGRDAAQRWEERANSARAQGMKSLAPFQLERWFSDGFCGRESVLCEGLLEVFVGNDLASYTEACRAMGAFDVRAQLATIDVPTVVIVGELDRATSPHHAAEIHARITRSVLHVIPEAKHLTPVERPDIVAGLLRPLLET